MAVIVEGKYDKIRLSNILDAVIITTDGFGIFKNKEKRELIGLLAQRCGIIILTDSDHAGQLIRKRVQSICQNGKIINIYLPPIYGKEKRKSTYSSERLLGVEGYDDSIIEEALKKHGIVGKKIEKRGRAITKTDLYNIGISGKDDAKVKRESFCKFLSLPQYIPTNSLTEVLNTLYGYDDFMQEVQKWTENEEVN